MSRRFLLCICNAGGLGSGQTLAPPRLPTDAEGTSTYARSGRFD